MAEKALRRRLLTGFLIGSAVVIIGAMIAGRQDASVPVARPAVAPADRLKEGWWAGRHKEVLERNKSNPNASLVLLGDSITQSHEEGKPPDENFQATWQRFYAPRRALNLGFSGDRTEHVLWRLDNGEVDGIRPRAVVLLVGANDLAAGRTAAQAEVGINAVVEKLRQKLPQASILLMGILPYEASESEAATGREINAYLSRRYESDAKITYLDVGPIFFKDGRLNSELFYDPTHPSSVGQRLLAEAIEPTLTRMLQDSSRQYLATLADVNTAVIPVPRLEMDSYDWYERHKEVLAAKAQMKPQIVLIGDSITHFWAGPPKAQRISGPQAWESLFGGASVLNLGFGWDRTQNVLWRLSHGEFDGLHPATAILNIGTNNLTGTENARASTPGEVVEGILAIHEFVHAHSPESRIIVMGIFPRGFSSTSPLRPVIAQTNQLLAQALAAKPNTTFLDIGARLLTPDGTLTRKIMDDGTHPTEEGYKIWAAALAEAGVTR